MGPILWLSRTKVSRITKEDRLDGWDAISNYLGWHPRTIIRWEKKKGLPVHRVTGGTRQPVYAYRSEIDQWFQKNGKVATVPAGLSTGSELVNIDKPVVSVFSHFRNRSYSIPTAVTIAAPLVFLAVAGAIAWKRPLNPTLQIAAITQLTDDGAMKRGLVTDGQQLYFTERFGETSQLSRMSIDGGPIQGLPLPLISPIPQDISADGKTLLVLSDNQEQHPLWLVPTNGGLPQRVGDVTCRTATWGPRGMSIVCARGNEIDLVSTSGSMIRLLGRLDGIPVALVWSTSRKQLFVSALSKPEGAPAFFRINFDDSLNPMAILRLGAPGNGRWREGLIARDIDGVFAVASDSNAGQILRYTQSLFAMWGPLKAFTLNASFHTIEGLASDPNSKRLFVLNSNPQRGELVRFDPKNQRFTNLLPGVSGTYLDFEPKQNRVAYVQSFDKSLWISNLDGTSARQMTRPEMEVTLPKWSPDGMNIAFLGKFPSRPYRIYVMSSDSREYREASVGDDNQGAPTWSPDGRYLVYGNVLCQEENTCAIHRIDLASGAVTELPNSHGLTTARWSPDGRHIAALNPVQHEIQDFELSTRGWRKLADNINGNDLTWSADSANVYARNTTVSGTKILRVNVSRGTVETVMDLDAISKSAGHLDTWFTLARDNTIVFNHWLSPSEIYTVKYGEN